MGKNIVTFILIILVVALAVLSWSLYSGVTECKTVATDLGTKLQQCAVGVEACQDALTALGQVPACAPYIPAQ